MQIEVWINGEKTKRHVITADTVTGEIVRYVDDDDGIPVIEGDSLARITEWHDRVEIRGSLLLDDLLRRK